MLYAETIDILVVDVLNYIRDIGVQLGEHEEDAIIDLIEKHLDPFCQGYQNYN